MEDKHLQVLNELVVVRSLLKEAEAATVDIARKLSFSHDESDGWPVLCLKAVDGSDDTAPSLKVQGNSRGQIVICSNLLESSRVVDLEGDASHIELKEAVLGLVSSMLDWTVDPTGIVEQTMEEDELYTDEMENDGELFESVAETADEDLEALPDIKL